MARVLLIERRYRDRSNLRFPGKPHRKLTIGLVRVARVVEQLKIGPRARNNGEARAREQTAEQIAFALVEAAKLQVMLGMCAQEVCEA